MKALHLIATVLVVLICNSVSAQSTYTFTTCGAIGRTGPTQAEVNSAYSATNLSGLITSNGGIQAWTVPQSGIYSIEAAGAQGAPASATTGGRGARIKGEFELIAGDVLHILVGQQGQFSPARQYLSSPGGGGSFVINATTNTPLIIAGGGGGTGNELPANSHGSVTGSGNDSEISNTGGSGGSGGTSGISSAGAGGGYLTNGTLSGGAGGNAYVNGGLGGVTNTTYAPLGGGFGGGASITSGGNSRYGGGGGYSGGGGSNSLSGATSGLWGGGGGSLNAGLNTINLAGDNFGDGQVIIELLSDPVPNDAGMASIDSLPSSLCQGIYSVYATVANFGNNQINPVTISWNVNNGPTTSLNYTSVLDTNGGVGSSSASILLGNVNILGTTTIKVWSSMPNNQNDTVNSNDTATLTLSPALEGIYTIGTTGDFTSFNAAVDALTNYGICDSVIFDVEPIQFNEQITIGSIIGVSETATVTFRTDINTSSGQANLHYSPANSGENYTVSLNGASYIFFENLALSSDGSNFGRVVYFPSAADYVSFEGCSITGVEYSGTSQDLIPVFNASGAGVNNCSFVNNTIEGGSYSVYWYGGSSSSLEENNRFENNDLTKWSYMGMYSYYQNNLIFEGNHVEESEEFSYTTSYGMYRYYNDGESHVLRNKFITKGSGTNYGMYNYYADANLSSPAIVANNFFACTNPSSGGYGMYFYYSSYQHIHNNSIHFEGTPSAGARLYLSSASYSGNEFINNIVSVGGGDAIYLYDPSNGSYLISDFNDFYYPNSQLGYAYGATYPDLASYQLTSPGQDLNSISIDPDFVSSSDLHVCQIQLHDAGSTTIANTVDVDGNSRNGFIDIGADEFMPGGAYNLGPDSTFCQSEYVLSVNEPYESIFWNSSTLPSSSANSYTLSAGPTPATFTVNVVITTAHCDLAFGSQTITLVPNVEFDSSSAHLCPGDAMVLDAGGGSTASYNWAPQNTTSKTISVNAPGIYIATKDEMGCLSKDTITVTATSAPALSNMDICDESIPYTADASVNGGLTYNWSGGSSTSTAVNELSDAGTYTVSITDAYGCNFEHSFDLDVIENPNAQINIQAISANSYTFAASSNSNVGSNATYQWTFGPNNATATGMIVTHIFPWSNAQTPPSYNVELTIENDCGSSLASTQVSPALGIENMNSKLDVRVFPNPMQDFARIAFVGNHSNISIDVIDIAGRVVMSQFENSSDVIELDVSNLASGAYSIRISSDQSPVNVIPVIVQ